MKSLMGILVIVVLVLIFGGAAPGTRPAGDTQNRLSSLARRKALITRVKGHLATDEDAFAALSDPSPLVQSYGLQMAKSVKLSAKTLALAVEMLKRDDPALREGALDVATATNTRVADKQKMVARAREEGLAGLKWYTQDQGIISGPMTREILKSLESTDAAERLLAVETLHDCTVFQDMVPLTLAKIASHDGDANLRKAALRSLGDVLGKLGYDLNEAKEVKFQAALMTLLNDSDVAGRPLAMAINNLVQIKKPSQPADAIHGIRRLFQTASTREEVTSAQQGLLWVLYRPLDRDPKASWEVLRSLDPDLLAKAHDMMVEWRVDFVWKYGLEHGSSAERLTSLDALTQSAQLDAPMLPALVKAFGDADAGVRSRVLKAVGDIVINQHNGSRASQSEKKMVISIVCDGLKDSDPTNQSRAFYIATDPFCLNDTRVVDAMIAFAGGTGRLRGPAWDVLGDLPDDSKERLATAGVGEWLPAALEDPSEDVRAAARKLWPKFRGTESPVGPKQANMVSMMTVLAELGVGLLSLFGLWGFLRSRVAGGDFEASAAHLRASMVGRLTGHLLMWGLSFILIYMAADQGTAGMFTADLVPLLITVSMILGGFALYTWSRAVKNGSQFNVVVLMVLVVLACLVFGGGLALDVVGGIIFRTPLKPAVGIRLVLEALVTIGCADVFLNLWRAGSARMNASDPFGV